MPSSVSTRSGVRGAILAGVLTAALAFIPVGAASADPVPGESASDAVTRLADLSRESEQTTEAMHNAQIDLDAKLAAQSDADGRLDADRRALADARAQIDSVRPAVDKIARANYQGARTNRLFAVMVSDSPQQLLDQMSALDIISTDAAATVGTFNEATAAAAAAEAASQQSADAARTATEQAKAVSDDLQGKQSRLQSEIADVMAAFGALSEPEKAGLAGAAFPPGFDPATILGALTPGSQTGALQAAFTQIGKPYVWGATGPDGYDCSGLVVWAYKQVGKTLPRSSQAQAAGGTPVAKEDLQPGDVVLFYNDASHVGLYAGNGNVVHASTFGVPVRVESMASWPFYGARRY
ncbi:protein p60 precursor [Rhodococcus sp. Leaf7]|uniref:C40 family peptidase n=1 Tax=unclassified Rhodococcus (in: high G+C Gram-positive bacteria) TaxID=192944 RepID=UPI0007011E81|nr:protein p60 precursor [Rhodococcus sp. Leaf7]KQU38095.1 protein p60 precursor [Rhodococcus sp. Leaf247]